MGILEKILLYNRRNIILVLLLCTFSLLAVDIFWQKTCEPIIIDTPDCQSFFLELSSDSNVTIVNGDGENRWVDANGLFLDFGDNILIDDKTFWRVKCVPSYVFEDVVFEDVEDSNG